ncbi:AMP-dependent synthetase and ligase family protein, putative isoform 2 [Hibiscus syriacus]|uniref:AMP-dependent synthetase and ligase family protein, putative isoform 2 n=1 Tax=Hibiscus syriacus TaxID=106335 RepID=A0A6A2XQX9_HIBSY|nr:AMP-dependent synthetase and ligase family protein, putative isoform 2 [Hibiscus syriacus]
MACSSDDEQETQQQHCCLSHEFYTAASKNPEKIAIIHASPSKPSATGVHFDRELINGGIPPVYKGDRCFTFADLLASVEYLSFRLRSVLGDADDPYLIKPQTSGDKSNGKHPGSVQMSEASLNFIRGVCQHTDLEDMYIPKTVALFMPPSVEYIVSVLSVLKCGEAFLPLDPSWPRDRILSTLTSSNASLVIMCGSSFGESGSELLDQSHWISECSSCPILRFSMEARIKPHKSQPSLAWPCENERKRLFCYLMYTSGSAEKPKGAYSINRLTAVPSLMRMILPVMQSQHDIHISSSLKLLILSGEILPLSLWNMLSSLLPKTTILNLYGSTEVSGDCLYFDCKRLPSILEMEKLTSVPIGLPISKCSTVLIGETNNPNVGEIFVRGLCVSTGYFFENAIIPLKNAKLHRKSICKCSMEDCGSQIYFRTGDFAHLLPSGDLVFLGRKDRTINVNGQRIALEEVEDTLRGHSDVVDAAVIFQKNQGEDEFIIAFILLKEKVNGKVDYAQLSDSIFSVSHVQDEISDTGASNLMQVIKKAFCNALMVEDVSDDDDFFMIGGNSIAAAYVSHNLGINMRLMYTFSTPAKLLASFLEKKVSNNTKFGTNDNPESIMEPNKVNEFSVIESETLNTLGLKLQRPFSRTSYERNDDQADWSKRLKVDLDKYYALQPVDWFCGYPWNSSPMPKSCSFSRCNKVMREGRHVVNGNWQAQSVEVSGSRTGYLQELWKVHMESCVDASPLVVFKDSDIYLFVGSHSHKFLCINAKSGKPDYKDELKVLRQL